MWDMRELWGFNYCGLLMDCVSPCCILRILIFILFFRRLAFTFICIYELYVCGCVHVSELLELELQAVVSTLTDMLETELATSEERARTLNH